MSKGEKDIELKNNSAKNILDDEDEGGDLVLTVESDGTEQVTGTETDKVKLSNKRKSKIELVDDERFKFVGNKKSPDKPMNKEFKKANFKQNKSINRKIFFNKIKGSLKIQNIFKLLSFGLSLFFMLALIGLVLMMLNYVNNSNWIMALVCVPVAAVLVFINKEINS